MKITLMKYYIYIFLAIVAGCKNNKAESSSSKMVNTVYAKVETEPVNAAIEDDSADDPCILVNELDREKSLIIGTNKKRGFNVYNLLGDLVKHYPVGRLNNIDIRQNIMVNGESIHILGATNRTNNTIMIYKIDENGKAEDIAAAPIYSTLSEVYGFCFYEDKSQNKLYAYANDKYGNIEQILLNNENGKITGELVRMLKVKSQVEGMVADDEFGYLYVGEEEFGVWKFNAQEHADTVATQLTSSTQSNPNIVYDIEGLSLYLKEDGKGYLIASIQGNNSYAVFKREQGNEYITSFNIGSNKIDGVEETDGIDLCSASLGSEYPNGIMVVQDGFNYDDTIKQPQNFKLIAFDEIDRFLDLN